MADYDIELAAEKAVQAFLRSKEIDWVQPAGGIGNDRIYCGLENLESEADEGEDSSIERVPCIICAAQNARAVLPNYHGNWDVDLVVTVKNQGDDITGLIHAQRVRGLYAFFYTTTIANDLAKAIPEFYVAKVVPTGRDYEVQGRSWTHHLRFTLISAAAIEV